MEGVVGLLSALALLPFTFAVDRIKTNIIAGIFHFLLLSACVVAAVLLSINPPLTELLFFSPELYVFTALVTAGALVWAGEGIIRGIELLFPPSPPHLNEANREEPRRPNRSTYNLYFREFSLNHHPIPNIRRSSSEPIRTLTTLPNGFSLIDTDIAEIREKGELSDPITYEEIKNPTQPVVCVPTNNSSTTYRLYTEATIKRLIPNNETRFTEPCNRADIAVKNIFTVPFRLLQEKYASAPSNAPHNSEIMPRRIKRT